MMDIRVGDVLTMKKQHPCGSNTWTVLRIGCTSNYVDELKCTGCGREIMLPRFQAEKNIKAVRHE